MHVLFVPRPPEALRLLARSLLPADHTLEFISEDAPSYLEELARADVLIGVPRKKLGADFLATAPRLQLVQQLRRGVDQMDLDAMKARDVQVATIGDLTAPFVAEHTIAMILALCRDLFGQHALVQDGRWTEAKPWQKPHGQVDSVPFVQCVGARGKTLGLVGMGNIGKHVARMAQALGMKVVATTTAAAGELREGVPQLELDDLLATSDVVSLHLPLTGETRGIMSAEKLARMRPGSFLVNTSRGALVDESALDAALESGHVRGAALDTLVKEPPSPELPLLRRSNVLLTPHSGWLGEESWRCVLEAGFENLASFVSGAPLRFQVI